MTLQFPATPSDGDVIYTEGQHFMWDANMSCWKPLPPVQGNGLREYIDPADDGTFSQHFQHWRIMGPILECWGFINSGGTGWKTITFAKRFKEGTTPGFVSSHVTNNNRTMTARDVGVTSALTASYDRSANSTDNNFCWQAVGFWDGVS